MVVALIKCISINVTAILVFIVVIPRRDLKQSLFFLSGLSSQLVLFIQSMNKIRSILNIEVNVRTSIIISCRINTILKKSTLTISQRQEFVVQSKTLGFPSLELRELGEIASLVKYLQRKTGNLDFPYMPLTYIVHVQLNNVQLLYCHHAF